MMKPHKNKQDKAPRPVSLITVYDSGSVVSEQYRTLRSNIKFSVIDGTLRTMLVTSSASGEGKSTTTDNLAVVFADSGMKTLLIDADMRKPTVALTFKLPNQYGLSNLLSDRKHKASEFVQYSGIPNLDVLTSGPVPPKPADMLASKRMDELLEELKQSYDLVIFDTPPLTRVTDAQILSSRVDGTVLVAREGETKKQTLMKSKELLELANANILGVVYNATNRHGDEGYYGYSYKMPDKE